MEGNLLLGVASIPKGVETTSPRRNPTFVCQSYERNCSKGPAGNNTDEQEFFKLLGGDVRAYDLGECYNLQETEHTYNDMLVKARRG